MFSGSSPFSYSLLEQSEPQRDFKILEQQYLQNISCIDGYLANINGDIQTIKIKTVKLLENKNLLKKSLKDYYLQLSIFNPNRPDPKVNYIEKLISLADQDIEELIQSHQGLAEWHSTLTEDREKQSEGLRNLDIEIQESKTDESSYLYQPPRF